MDLGRRLKQARLDAGLSQRQLCGTEITEICFPRLKTAMPFIQKNFLTEIILWRFWI